MMQKSCFSKFSEVNLVHRTYTIKLAADNRRSPSAEVGGVKTFLYANILMLENPEVLISLQLSEGLM